MLQIHRLIGSISFDNLDDGIKLMLSLGLSSDLQIDKDRSDRYMQMALAVFDAAGSAYEGLSQMYHEAKQNPLDSKKKAAALKNADSYLGFDVEQLLIDIDYKSAKPGSSIYERCVSEAKHRAFEACMNGGQLSFEKDWDAIFSLSRAVSNLVALYCRLKEREEKPAQSGSMSADQVRKARTLLGLTQEEFALELGWTSKRNITNLEDAQNSKKCTVQTSMAIELLLRKAGLFSEFQSTGKQQ